MDNIKSNRFILRDYIGLINECTFHLQNKIYMLEQSNVILYTNMIEFQKKG